MFPGPDRLCAQGPEGRFVHELILPFVRTHGAGPRLLPQTPPVRTAVRRVFPPGCEWLYAKLYTGTATADQVLREVVRPLTEAPQRSGAVDRWFFIRYGDPDWHLRLRFHGDPKRPRLEVLHALEAAVVPLLADGRLWRVQLDTYEREVERYGGGEGVRLAERLFHADSEAVLTAMDDLTGDAGAEAR